ncbi:MAG: tetratricopeptide repeat protein [Desulfomonile tiedjei]|nr:tetratricopeptide repeat protein [Desulfomonile tiedjei]
MDAGTYPDQAVIQFIRENVIPMRLLHDQQPLAGRFSVTWTPTLILIDAQGKEVYRNEGALGPAGLIPALMLGIGKEKSHSGHYDKAVSYFDELTSKYPKSEEAPEAIYYRGVARFKSTKDIKAMKEAYLQLSAAYPGSPWTRKAQPYASLK